jgi:phosphatidylserine decarboxylase
MRIAKEGLIFILPCAVLAAVFWFVGWWPLTILFVLFGGAFEFFFRDPKRALPPGEDLVLAPADGKVLAVDSLPGHPDLPGPVTRITIFLSILDVHIVRSPLTVKVVRISSRPGKFLRADKPEAGSANTSRTLVFRGKTFDFVLKLIVGVAARRIKTTIHENDTVLRGQKIGLMYFGSRAEVFLPAGVSVKIRPGERVKAGVTVIAEVRP